MRASRPVRSCDLWIRLLFHILLKNKRENNLYFGTLEKISAVCVCTVPSRSSIANMDIMQKLICHIMIHGLTFRLRQLFP